MLKHIINDDFEVIASVEQGENDEIVTNEVNSIISEDLLQALISYGSNVVFINNELEGTTL